MVKPADVKSDMPTMAKTAELLVNEQNSPVQDGITIL
jgi:hypothetical protein